MAFAECGRSAPAAVLEARRAARDVLVEKYSLSQWSRQAEYTDGAKAFARHVESHFSELANQAAPMFGYPRGKYLIDEIRYNPELHNSYARFLRPTRIGPTGNPHRVIEIGPWTLRGGPPAEVSSCPVHQAGFLGQASILLHELEHAASWTWDFRVALDRGRSSAEALSEVRDPKHYGADEAWKRNSPVDSKYAAEERRAEDRAVRLASLLFEGVVSEALERIARAYVDYYTPRPGSESLGSVVRRFLRTSALQVGFGSSADPDTEAKRAARLEAEVRSGGLFGGLLCGGKVTPPPSRPKSARVQTNATGEIGWLECTLQSDGKEFTPARTRPFPTSFIRAALGVVWPRERGLSSSLDGSESGLLTLTSTGKWAVHPALTDGLIGAVAEMLESIPFRWNADGEHVGGAFGTDSVGQRAFDGRFALGRLLFVEGPQRVIVEDGLIRSLPSAENSRRFDVLEQVAPPSEVGTAIRTRNTHQSVASASVDAPLNPVRSAIPRQPKVENRWVPMAEGVLDASGGGLAFRWWDWFLECLAIARWLRAHLVESSQDLVGALLPATCSTTREWQFPSPFAAAQAAPTGIGTYAERLIRESDLTGRVPVLLRVTKLRGCIVSAECAHLRSDESTAHTFGWLPLPGSGRRIRAPLSPLCYAWDTWRPPSGATFSLRWVRGVEWLVSQSQASRWTRAPRLLERIGTFVRSLGQMIAWWRGHPISFLGRVLRGRLPESPWVSRRIEANGSGRVESTSTWLQHETVNTNHAIRLTDRVASICRQLDDVSAWRQSVVDLRASIQEVCSQSPHRRDILAIRSARSKGDIDSWVDWSVLDMWTAPDSLPPDSMNALRLWVGQASVGRVKCPAAVAHLAALAVATPMLTLGREVRPENFDRRDLRRALESGGECNAQAIVAAAIGVAAGFEARVCHGAMPNGPLTVGDEARLMGHAWAELRTESGQFMLDGFTSSHLRFVEAVQVFGGPRSTLTGPVTGVEGAIVALVVDRRQQSPRVSVTAESVDSGEGLTSWLASVCRDSPCSDRADSDLLRDILDVTADCCCRSCLTNSRRHWAVAQIAYNLRMRGWRDSELDAWLAPILVPGPFSLLVGGKLAEAIIALERPPALSWLSVGCRAAETAASEFLAAHANQVCLLRDEASRLGTRAPTTR